MYRCNKAFDKNVKEYMWTLCQNCYDIRLEELEKKEESQRKKTKQDKKKKSCQRSSRRSGRNGVLDCCPRNELIFVVWNWMRTLVGSLKTHRKIGKKLH